MAEKQNHLEKIGIFYVSQCAELAEASDYLGGTAPLLICWKKSNDDPNTLDAKWQKWCFLRGNAAASRWATADAPAVF